MFKGFFYGRSTSFRCALILDPVMDRSVTIANVNGFSREFT